MKIWLCAFLSVFVTNVFSAEYQYSINASLTNSDNISRITNGDSGSSLNTGISFVINNSTNNEWLVDIAGDFSIEKFSDSDIDSQQYKEFFGRIEYQPTSNNFNLRIIQEVSQEPRDRFSTNSANNLRDSSIFSVRPSYFFTISSLDRLNFEYGYIDSNNDDISNGASNIDGSRKTEEYSVSFERQINSTQQLFLVFNSLQTNFDALLTDGAVDYEQEDVYLRWVVQGRATQVQVEYGESVITDVLGNEVTTDRSNFFVQRSFNSLHSLSFNTRKGFDSQINENFSTNVVNVDPQAVNFITPQEVKQNTLVYNYEKDNFVIDIRVFDIETTGTINTNSEKQSGGEIVLVYPLPKPIWGNNRSDLRFSYLESKNKFNTTFSQVSENDSSIIGVTYSQYISNESSVYFQIRSQNVAGDAFGSFQADSKSITIGIRYSPTGRF